MIIGSRGCLSLCVDLVNFGVFGHLSVFLVSGAGCAEIGRLGFVVVIAGSSGSFEHVGRCHFLYHC